MIDIDGLEKYFAEGEAFGFNASAIWSDVGRKIIAELRAGRELRKAIGPVHEASFSSLFKATKKYDQAVAGAEEK